MMRTTLSLIGALTVLVAGECLSFADDPFAGGADALAVAESDGSASLRAKKKLTKIDPDMAIVQLRQADDSQFPNCLFTARVLTAPVKKDGYFKLIGAGKTYRFQPMLKMNGEAVDLKDEATQNNLGACYYPTKSNLVVQIAGVDKAAKLFQVKNLSLK